MRKKIDIKIFIGVCIILVSGLVYFFLEVYTPDDTTEYIKVIVAKENIKANTLIKEDMLMVQTRVAPLTEKHVINNLKEIVGKRATSLLVEGETIKSFRLGDDMDDYAIMQSNVRELVIPITGVDGGLKLRAGGYIDVIGRPGENTDPVLLLSGKQIIYMRSTDGRLIEDNKDVGVSSVVVLVNLDEYREFVLKTNKVGGMTPDILSYGVIENVDDMIPFTVRSNRPNIQGLESVTYFDGVNTVTEHFGVGGE